MGEADFYYFTCLKLEFIYLSGRTFLTKGKSHQNGFWKHLECSPQEVRTRIPVLQSLQQRSRSDPQIRFEHVPSMLPSIRQRHRLQENGLKSRMPRGCLRDIGDPVGEAKKRRGEFRRHWKSASRFKKTDKYRPFSIVESFISVEKNLVTIDKSRKINVPSNYCLIIETK